MRQMAQTRQPWQKRGIVIFESFYYIMTRFALIFGSFLLAQANSILISLDTIDGRFGNEWVYCCVALNLTLMTDLVLHVIFYGYETILKLRKEYIWEAMCQIFVFVTLILYYTCDIDDLNKQI